MTPPLLRMAGIGKAFSGVTVLDDVDFELRAGETHALLGGNGAGKSTLMKILEGVYALDRGTVELDGEAVELGTPQAARRHGVAMIFQEFSLVPTLTVAQNIYLTREARTRAGLLDDRSLERRAGELLAELGVDIDPRLEVSRLSTASLAARRDRKGALAGRAHPDHGRADRLARPQRGRRAVSDHRAPQGARHHDRVHHAPPRGGHRHGRPRDRAARRERRGHAADVRARYGGAHRAHRRALGRSRDRSTPAARPTGPARRCCPCAT